MAPHAPATSSPFVFVYQGWDLCEDSEQHSKWLSQQQAPRHSTSTMRMPVYSFSSHFREHLRRVRIFHNMTIQEVAESVGVTSQKIKDYESGRAFPSSDVLRRLQHTFKQSLIQVDGDA